MGEAMKSAVMEGPALSGADVSELFAAFTEATRRLEATHDALRGQVARLERELQAANEQLRRSEALAALGEVAAGIAHEVRNPLAAIGLHARLLEKDLADRPAERVAAERISAAVRAADAVVADVLAFAREVRPRLTEVEAPALMEEAAAACGHLFAGGGVALARGAAADGMWVRADGGLMRQALVNVIRNAVEASAEAGEGGRVTLLVGERRVREARGGSVAMVSLGVRDTGPGISDEVRERMFNPFFTTRAAGTGLGLAIVHRIVDAHGGRVEVTNVAGPRGAMVELLLPKAETGEQA